jgi:hypothetical protein
VLTYTSQATSTCYGARLQLSHSLKLTLFVLAFNVIGFVEGYLLRDLGLVFPSCLRSGTGTTAAAELLWDYLL